MARMREINFNKYCALCKYRDLKESQEPCNTCLETPAKDELDAYPDCYEPKDEVN